MLLISIVLFIYFNFERPHYKIYFRPLDMLDRPWYLHMKSKEEKDVIFVNKMDKVLPLLLQFI